jgi:hypothetical protein
MPCGSLARLTAYVLYQRLAFAERDVLLAALADAGYTNVESAAQDAAAPNSVPVTDGTGRVVAAAAIVVRDQRSTSGFGDLGLVLIDDVYVPLVPGDGRADQVLRALRGAYGRAKATQLAEQARRRYQATVQRSTAENGTVTIRVRF